MDAKTVLLIDADEDSRLICQTILQHHGYAVVATASGAQGMHRAVELQPALVLLDLALPVLDGWAVLHHLRATPLTATIPVVIVTSLAFDTERTRAGQRGCAGFLSKPCPPLVLLDEVRRVVG